MSAKKKKNQWRDRLRTFDPVENAREWYRRQGIKPPRTSVAHENPLPIGERIEGVVFGGALSEQERLLLGLGDVVPQRERELGGAATVFIEDSVLADNTMISADWRTQPREQDCPERAKKRETLADGTTTFGWCEHAARMLRCPDREEDNVG